MLGYGTIALTLDTYSPLVPALQEQAAATIDSLFGTAKEGIFRVWLQTWLQ